jgi:hypothetical protein
MAAEEKVPIADALERIIDKFVMEQGTLYETYVRPMLPQIADRIIEELPLFNYEIVEKKVGG